MRIDQRQVQKLVITDTEEIYLEFLETNAQLLSYKIGGSVPPEVFDSVPSSNDSLSSYLDGLIPLLRLDGVEEEIADYIIYNLDDSGNLLVETEEIARKFSVELKDVKRIMDLIKTIGPSGLFEGKVIGFGEGAPIITADMTVNDDLSIEIFTPVSEDPVIERALKKREETLRAVGKVLIEVNSSFFLGHRLLPRRMKIKDLARRIGRSISTASRAVKDKYVSSPRGTLPLSLFFGRSVHPELMKRLIAVVVEEYGEVSDSFIASRMRDMGYEVSRRTVNKYRKILKRSREGSL